LNWMQVTESKRNYIRRTMLLQCLDSERDGVGWFWSDVRTIVSVWEGFQTISAWHVPQPYCFIHWWWKQILQELKDGYKGCWTSRKLQWIHNNYTSNSTCCRNGQVPSKKKTKMLCMVSGCPHMLSVYLSTE